MALLKKYVLKFPFPFAVVLSGVLPGKAQLVFPVLGLLIAGISHGALDHELDPSASRSKFKFYASYLLWIVLFFVMWRTQPLFALGLFLLYSADHFGECEFISTLTSNGQSVASTRGVFLASRFWGLFAASFSQLFHWNESFPIIKALLLNARFMDQISLFEARGVSAVLAIGALISAFYFDRVETRSDRVSRHLIWTFALVLSFAVLPMIPGFLCFFCFWHSWDSILQQRRVMGWSALEYAARGSLYSVIAWIGLMGLAVWGSFTEQGLEFLPLVFVLLGALTLSHSRVMKRFYFRK